MKVKSIVFIEGQRASQQMVDTDGYIYSRKKPKDSALYSAWRCRKRTPPTKCLCHAYLTLSDNSLSLSSKAHDHPADNAAPQKREVLSNLKRNMVEGFHRGFKSRVNRPKPTVQEYFRAIREQQVITDYHIDQLGFAKTSSLS